MQVNNPPDRVGIISTLEHSPIKISSIPIGAWNMDADHDKGVDIDASILMTKIISISVIINNDAQTFYWDLLRADWEGASTVMEGSIKLIQPGRIILARCNGGIFDSVNFSSILISRGTLTILYLE